MHAAKKAEGTDDTVKLSGRTAFDAKTGIIIRRRREETKNLQGEDSAETVTVFLSQVGACIDLNEKEVLGMFDFLWVTGLLTTILCWTYWKYKRKHG